MSGTTPQQLPLFDGAAARAARDAGMRRVWDRAPELWKAYAELHCEAVLRRERTVTADDLRAAVDFEPHHFNSWGALTGRLIRRGWLVPTGRYAVSAQVQGHGNRQPVYESALYGRAKGEEAA